MSDQNKWSQPANPPPPLFLGDKERKLVKQVNDELIERVIGQTIVYYTIILEHNNFNPLYEEAIEKSFLPPVRVYALVEWGGAKTETTGYGLDKSADLIVHFHYKRLTEDQDLYVREGDFVLYDGAFYEITVTAQPRRLFGQDNHQVEITANCIQARSGVFNAK
jgi:hypothetical protein